MYTATQKRGKQNKLGLATTYRDDNWKFNNKNVIAQNQDNLNLYTVPVHISIIKDNFRLPCITDDNNTVIVHKIMIMPLVEFIPYIHYALILIIIFHPIDIPTTTK